MTRQRALILEILQHSPKHLTADEIFAIAREKMPGIARGTVYRNLKLMEQAREIARLEMPDGPDRFDKTSNPHGHLHAVFGVSPYIPFYGSFVFSTTPHTRALYLRLVVLL